MNWFASEKSIVKLVLPISLVIGGYRGMNRYLNPETAAWLRMSGIRQWNVVTEAGSRNNYEIQFPDDVGAVLFKMRYSEEIDAEVERRRRCTTKR